MMCLVTELYLVVKSCSSNCKTGFEYLSVSTVMTLVTSDISVCGVHFE